MSDEQREETVEQVDGYGNPFPPEAQERHIHAILGHIYKPKEPTIYPPQVEWKDKPAGQYTKGSGV